MEITLGVLLKGLRLPFAGEVLTAGAAIIVLNGKYFAPQRGSVFLMGLVAAVLKLFSLGNVIIGPFMAIIMEGLIAEIILLIFRLNLFSFLFTGAILQLYTVVHPFIAQGLIYGGDIYKLYAEIYEQVISYTGLTENDIVLILIIYTAFHMSFGVLAGFFAWKLKQSIVEKLKEK